MIPPAIGAIEARGSSRAAWRSSLVHAARAARSTFGPGWRLALPLLAILSIIAIAGALLYVAHAFEHGRQEQRLIADTLWAEQSLSYEVVRMTDGIRSLQRGAGPSAPLDAASFEARGTALMQRDQAILAMDIWSQRLGDFATGGLANQSIAPVALRAVALRAQRLGRAATIEIEGERSGNTRMLLAVPLDSQRGEVVVAVVSLRRLLQNTVPWWLAHSARITLDDSAGVTLAQRDDHVQGRGVYTHKIATTFVDRTLYLHADSTQGTPFLIPNLLALSIFVLSLVLAWTVWELWRDLRKRTRAENALRAQQALQTAMEGALVVGLRACDMQGRITYANPAFCDMVGYRLDELRAMAPPLPFWTPGANDPLTPDDAGGSAAHVTHEGRLTRRAGDVIDVLTHEAPLLDGAGSQIGWMASVHDVSEQRRNAELLHAEEARTQRMARLMTMGEMASALAHELNQPLAAANSYITAGINLTSDPLDPSDIVTASVYFAKAREQTSRAGEIIKRVRQFVGHSMPILQPLNVTDVLRDLLPLIRLQDADADTPLVASLARPLPAVLADRVLLEQIVLNLTRNAFEAMKGVSPDRRRIELFCRLPDGGRSGVCLGVRDQGPGLGDAAATILSTTLASTKPGGLGMGLAVCRKAAELLGTRLEYRPVDGGGAEFHLVLNAAGKD